MNDVLIIGSVAFDTLRNPVGVFPKELGGSALYASLSASYYAPARLVAVVGRDFPERGVEMLRKRKVDVEGLEVAEGETFHWDGQYTDDLRHRTTLKTELNVFADFKPRLPASYANSPYVLLGNIHPELQLEVLDQIKSPRLVVTDTMNFWIEGQLEALKKVLKRTDVLIVNEEEGRQLAGVEPILKVVHALSAMGPKIVVIKQGEYGAFLFDGREPFSAPAYPVEDLRDPTGAGDSFAGGFLGSIAQQGDLSSSTLRRAMIYGSTMASFCVEATGVAALNRLDRPPIEERFRLFQRMAHVPGSAEVELETTSRQSTAHA